MRSLLLPLVLAATPLAAQWKAPADSSIRRHLEARVAAENGAGIVVGVVESGTPRFIGTRGVDQRTIFEIGSVSKTFTTTLLAHMVVSGEVKLDDPVQQYLPATVKMPARDGKQITLLDLATSTSGLPRMPPIEPTDPRNPYADYDATKLYAFLNGYTLPRDPGAAYEYSNLGMGLLGHVLERKGGKPYDVLVRERILAPLGMKETWVVIPAKERARVAQGHNREGEPVLNWDFDVLVGAGGWRSTPEDMARYLEAAMNPPATPLGQAMKLAMTGQRPTGMAQVSIALGWHLIDRPEGQIVLHNGETGGYHTWVGFNRKSGANALVLSASAHDIDDIGLNLADSTIPRREPPPPRPTVQVSTAIMDEYVGRYELAPTFAIEVTREGSNLYVQATNQPRFRVFPASETRWFLKVVAAEVEFGRDAAGKVNQLTLHQGGRSTPGPKTR